MKDLFELRTVRRDTDNAVFIRKEDVANMIRTIINDTEVEALRSRMIDLAKHIDKLGGDSPPLFYHPGDL